MDKDEPKESRVGFYAWVTTGYGIINIADQETYDALTREKMNFKSRTKPMVEPTPDECHKFGLSVAEYYNSVKEADFIADSCVWVSGHRGDEEPYYCLYNCGTNDLRIVENNNGVWRNVKPQEICNLYGLMWKMLLMVKDRRI